MGTGYLRVQATAGGAIPIAGAEVIVSQSGNATFHRTTTDFNGSTENIPLSAPSAALSCEENNICAPYSLSDVQISANGYITKRINDVEIFDTETAILPVNMEPIIGNPSSSVTIDIPPNGLSSREPALCLIKASSPARSQRVVFIPDYITVHLGRPHETAARNVRVRFTDYIKNVASSEIYATWPEQSLRANIHAITTFALNRVYTEWYPNKGYNFDITSSTAYDQYYRHEGPIYENISIIADEIFNVYAHRYGYRNPYFTQFCDGRTVTCPGMSQWGTVTLANQGLEAIEILHYYFPRDLILTATDNIMGIEYSFPGYNLSLEAESAGEDVRRIQNDLNRIRINYPLIPQITNPNGVFGTETREAVITFQQAFSLPPNGIVDRKTWNKISSTFTAVSRIAELGGEGIRYTIGQNPPDVTLSLGARGSDVLEMQFIINIVSAFFPSVPTVVADSVFSAEDRNAVTEFQKTFDLPQTGIVNARTWDMLYFVYRGIRENVSIPE